jgi:hypothetical protein
MDGVKLIPADVRILHLDKDSALLSVVIREAETGNQENVQHGRAGGPAPEKDFTGSAEAGHLKTGYGGT